MTELGFIGLGIMGRTMAGHLFALLRVLERRASHAVAGSRE